MNQAPIKRRESVNLLPLIDVIFIILVFFLYAFLNMDWQSQFKIDVPIVKNSDGLAKSEVQKIIVTKDGLIYFKEEKVTKKQLEIKLKALHKKSKILLIADKNSQLDITIYILDLCKAQNFKDISLKTK
ncbi:MAG: biopolymer transporter ExbD [Candidatus Cloacimonetes bacterium]|nr:biopolymer transporter ExbD [Candidatus Cloacimonadota bacterium]